MIIDDYPFSHGDQKSYQGMKGNSLEFSLEFIVNHSHTHDSSPQIYTRILRSSLFRFKPFYKYKKNRW